jgi:two-component system, cell cycle sensor histidine kinase and response regulator CckA
MNLVINASEALGENSGAISVGTGSLECSEEYLRDTWICDGIRSGLYVALEVSDTGCGMTRETLEKIFDPFFTTKFTGRGLGMAAVLGIVRSHKGAIKVYSEPGKGTTFRLLFPAGNQPGAVVAKPQDTVELWRGSGKVLLVDDEEIVRDLGTEMLKELGYEVLTAEDGRQALELFNSRKDISLVILDLTMPRMDGEQCFRALRKIDPEVRVVMSSGFNEQEVSRKFIGRGLSGFIQKPYTLTSLRDVLRYAQIQ